MVLFNLLLAARRSIGAWRRRQRAYAELMALGDRELADIGVHRSEIAALVAGRSDRAPAVQAEPARPSDWLPLLSPRV